MATGWLKLGGTWYFLTGDGHMASGWVKDGESWFYCQPSGAMVTGRVVVDGIAYTFDANGRLVP